MLGITREIALQRLEEAWTSPDAPRYYGYRLDVYYRGITNYIEVELPDLGIQVFKGMQGPVELEVYPRETRRVYFIPVRWAAAVIAKVPNKEVSSYYALQFFRQNNFVIRTRNELI